MIKWNEVTWYSWYGAIILFIVVLPVISFFIGREYEATRAVLLQKVEDAPFVPTVHVQASTTTEETVFNNKKDFSAVNMGEKGISFNVASVPEDTGKIKISYGKYPTGPWTQVGVFQYSSTSKQSFIAKIDGTKQSLYFNAEALSLSGDLLKEWNSVLVKKLPIK